MQYNVFFLIYFS